MDCQTNSINCLFIMLPIRRKREGRRREKGGKEERKRRKEERKERKKEKETE